MSSPKAPSSAFRNAIESIIEVHESEITELRRLLTRQKQEHEQEKAQLIQQIQSLSKENTKLEEEISSLTGNTEQNNTNYVRKRKKTPPSGHSNLNHILFETPSKFPTTKIQSSSVQRKSTFADELVNNEYSVVDLADDDQELNKVEIENKPIIIPITDSPEHKDSFSLMNIKKMKEKMSVKKHIPFLLDVPLNDDEDDFKAIDKKPNKIVKHVEVVRKKSEREKLPGHECEHCQKFYDAIDADGKIFDRNKMVNECSRHKHLYSPPDTPENFWQVSFPSSETQE